MPAQLLFIPTVLTRMEISILIIYYRQTKATEEYNRPKRMIQMLSCLGLFHETKKVRKTRQRDNQKYLEVLAPLSVKNINNNIAVSDLVKVLLVQSNVPNVIKECLHWSSLSPHLD